MIINLPSLLQRLGKPGEIVNRYVQVEWLDGKQNMKVGYALNLCLRSHSLAASFPGIFLDQRAAWTYDFTFVIVCLRTWAEDGALNYYLVLWWLTMWLCRFPQICRPDLGNLFDSCDVECLWVRQIFFHWKSWETENQWLVYTSWL